MTHFTKLLVVGSLLTMAALPVQAHDAGQWVVRGGVGTVAPKSNNLDLSDAGDTVIVDVDDGTSLVLTATYMLTENWAFDVLAAWPFNHDINLAENGVSEKVAETDHLPPTFSMQYHFLPSGTFQPYVGLGVNWTTFFNTDTVSELATLGVDLDLDDSIGLAAQIGADFLTGDRWLLNVDVRWANIETDATLGGVEIGSVEIDPWVYSIQFGYRF